MRIKTVEISVPAEIVVGFQTAIDRGWNGEFQIDSRDLLVMGIELVPGVGGKIVCAPLKKAKAG